MNEIWNASCVRNVMTVTPLFKIERETFDANSIIRNVDYGVYIYTCSVASLLS